MSFCFINNRICAMSEASVPIHDLGFLRGYALFDFFRTVKKTPLFLENHIQRITHASKVLHMHAYVKTIDFEKVIKKLITKIDKEDIAFKIIISGGNSSNGFSLSTPNLYIFPVSITLPTPSDYHNGLSVQLMKYIRDTPDIKTTNYLEAIKAMHTYKKNAFKDVLYVHDNIVSESSRANFFIIKNGEVMTTDKNILHGITRKKVVQIANEMGILVVKTLSKDEVFRADECFLTSTTKRIMPVTKVDNHTIGDGTIGPLTRQLLEKFVLLEKKYIEDINAKL